jgi:hypothetical protein
MISTVEFRKMTGVDINSTPAQLEKALGSQVAKETDSQIAIALIVRTLIVEHSWQVNSAAANVGLTNGTARTAGNRGKVLYETGAKSAALVWQTLRTLSDTVANELAATVQGMLTEDDRTAYVCRIGVRKVVATRMGENATPETIDALTDAIIADGHRTPVAARGVVDGIATRLGIELPKPQQAGNRSGSSSNAADDKADVPTFDQALMGALAAVKRVHEGTDEDHPLTLTSVQASLVDTLMTELLAIMDAAKVSA